MTPPTDQELSAFIEWLRQYFIKREARSTNVHSRAALQYRLDMLAALKFRAQITSLGKQIEMELYDH